ncbi:hypothetical protein DOTSEDRAFT_76280 [Dothistroma septosporum NZE10]|uniref:Fungal N-terminal domain-containing protein n=1 Tax=Dothistroma septosporum (strain NZE10 / CBS 128990) TaxID=675120 RepID=N1PYY6_DOTSN|nr:hypothetical protein DOTSEDRAFT_76280 [Dothistroma septosporum NZE10]
MAELQTIAAMFDLLKISDEVGKFLEKVKDAGKIANELGDRARDTDDHDETTGGDVQVAQRIKRSVLACSKTLEDLRTKLGGFDVAASRDLVNRARVAFRQPSINRIENELEARVQALSTDLAVLQLFEQTKSKSAIDDNHKPVLESISKLGTLMEEGNGLLGRLLAAHEGIVLQQIQSSRASDSPLIISSNNDAIESLTDSLRGAEEVHEHFTSEYNPDARSERTKRVDTEQQDGSPLIMATRSGAVATPFGDGLSVLSCPGSSNREATIEDDRDRGELDDEDVWPLEKWISTPLPTSTGLRRTEMRAT